MRLNKAYRAVLLLAVAIIIEMTVCQFSFYTSLPARGKDMTQEAELVYRYVPIEDMSAAEAEPAPPALPEAESGPASSAYTDGEGYVHVPEGAALIRLDALDQKVSLIHPDLTIPAGSQIKAAVFMQDEGNSEIYRLGDGRTLLSGVEENSFMKVYPYGKTDRLYLRLEAADRQQGGELVFRLNGLEINGRVPFTFRPVRMLVLFFILCFFRLLRKKGRLAETPFLSADQKGSRKRKAAIFVFTGSLMAAAFGAVMVNPDCRENLALHQAQYQELARALSQGQVSVRTAVPELLTVENPYDTIGLLARGIHYEADYSYYDGKYYVYFGIVPELLLYLPCYLLTGKDLPNYLAVFLFYEGFIIACAGFVYELMKRFFPKAPFYLYGIGVFVLAGSYPLFYLLIRPDLYNVPIVASCMFTAAGLWFWLAGLNRGTGKSALYFAGSLCMALTAGCRPQFLLFSILMLPLFWHEAFQKRALFSAGKWKRTAALFLPYFAVAAGIMYYNYVRFDNPFDFGAAYSMTSNDMTHRGFNLERILYGFWYFLFQPPRMEAAFPFLKSAAIETDYLGKMVTESCFGGIFACSLLFWPVFGMVHMRKRLRHKKLGLMTALCVIAAAVICAADANGAGILQRYSADIVFGFSLAAVIMLLMLAEWAGEKGLERQYLSLLRAAVLLHLCFLFLILVNTDSSVNLMKGNPVLFYTIQAMLRF